jgi:hypothetical protein
MIALGCHVNTPLPLPDATRESGIVLRAIPSSLVIPPGSSGHVRFEVRDANDLPVSDYPVEFSVSGTSEDTAGIGLSTQRGLTNTRGDVVVQVMVGALVNRDRPEAFSVHANCPGALAARADILVTTNAYAVEILPVPADDLLGLTFIATTRLHFFDNTICADLDLLDLGRSLGRARPPYIVGANTALVFPGVASTGSHAVVGLGLDNAGTERLGGCVDVPGSALLDSVTIRAVLLMDHLFPSLSGTYQVLSDFRFDPPPPALATIRWAWQQWSRCPMDPARLWIDCTIAALDDSSSGCLPAPASLGSLADTLLRSRGALETPTINSPSDTTCHGALDGNGNPSLEAAVASLFTYNRGPLAAAKLDAIPGELAALLDAIRIGSQLRVARANEANSYWVEHTLVGVTFPDALIPISFQSQTLGLPVTVPPVLLAAFQVGQVFIPSHGFSLRLGTSARFAFEATSLKTRGTNDSARFVESTFGLAQRNDSTGSLTGCEALDASACEHVGQPRGCLRQACQVGLARLATTLAQPFDSLDGSGLDFWLSGSAPVIDLEANGRADALGMAGGTGGVVAGPGLWSAVLEAGSGNYVTYGTWAATSVGATR